MGGRLSARRRSAIAGATVIIVSASFGIRQHGAHAGAAPAGPASTPSSATSPTSSAPAQAPGANAAQPNPSGQGGRDTNAAPPANPAGTGGADATQPSAGNQSRNPSEGAPSNANGTGVPGTDAGQSNSGTPGVPGTNVTPTNSAGSVAAGSNGATPGAGATLQSSGGAPPAGANSTQSFSGASPPSAGSDELNLADAQLGMISVGSVSERTFPLERQAVGSIDFNEDMSTQVFPPYQGRIVKLYAKIGDNVKRGQTLFTIESPDLIQADSNLIAAAGILELTTFALERAKKLYTVDGIAEKDLQQAVSDQQAAEGALKAARDAVAVFGKSQSDIDRMIKTRTIDPDLKVLSPMSGRITTRNAAPGDFVQPGNLPPPYSVADISRMWVNASVTESDMPLVRKGQKVHVTLMALPGRTFEGEIAVVGSAIDPQLHRGLIRAEIDDPNHELLPGMFASFVIVTGEPVTAAAVPLDGVVREGDGSMTVWVTTDRRRFVKRIVKVGLVHGGYDQILEGVRTGDGVVTKGAVFLDNLAASGAS